MFYFHRIEKDAIKRCTFVIFTEQQILWYDNTYDDLSSSLLQLVSIFALNNCSV